jgi:hypothetical protein
MSTARRKSFSPFRIIEDLVHGLGAGVGVEQRDGLLTAERRVRRP